MSDLGTTLDRLAANAWPALETEPLDGWRLRYNEGLHRRVNSVFPENDGVVPIDEKLAQAEAFYRERTMAPRFQISPACQPPRLDDILATRGYETESGVDIMVGDAAAIAGQTHSSATVELLPALNEDWLDVHMADTPDLETKARKGRMLTRIEMPHVFALAVVAGKPVAAGLGIYENGWCGIFGMFTLAHERRRGHGHALLCALADWTLARGGTRAYLQVERDNPPALAFYAKIGFRTVHGYHYRTLWAQSSGAPND